jgi:hypothetical protein
MKPFSLLKVSMLLVGFGAVLLFAPACKAQEVSPDHFDGNDSWEIAARKPVAAKAKSAANVGTYQARNQKTSAGPSLQMAAAREVTKSAPRTAVALRDKRKTAVRKSDPK